MNNLTKIAALPTGGGCQAALRAEDVGAEPKTLTQREAMESRWDAFYRNAPIVDVGVESQRLFSLDELTEVDPTVLPVIVYGTAKITGAYGRTYEVTMRDQHVGVVQRVWVDNKLVFPKEDPCS